MFRIAVPVAVACACLLTGCVTDKPHYVGTARMLADLSIEQQIVEHAPNGALGEARIVLRPGDAAYRETLDSVGGLRPGEIKAIPARAQS